MIRPLIFMAALAAVASMGIGAFEEAPAAQVRGRAVKMTCSNPPSGYIACRSRSLRTTVDIVLVKVDGSVFRRRVPTDRAGRFRVKLAPDSYYVFAVRPPQLGMPTEPVETTVPPEGISITLPVDVGHR